MRRLLPTLLRRRLSSTITAPSWALPLPEGVLGTVTELLATTGSRIHLDEVVAIIETDKLAVDVKAQNAGVVKSILVSVGDEVKVRQPLYALDVHAAPPPIDSEQHLAERMWARDREVRLEEERQRLVAQPTGTASPTTPAVPANFARFRRGQAANQPLLIG